MFEPSSSPIPSFNRLVTFPYSAMIAPRQGCFMKVADGTTEQDLRYLATRLDDMLDRVAWHVATQEYELTVSPPMGELSTSTLEPCNYDETLEKALQVCVINIPGDWLQSASLEVDLIVTQGTKFDPVILVETRLCGLDSRWNKKDAQNRARIAGQLFQDYWVSQHAWVTQSGLVRFSLRYDLMNIDERYPHSERAVIALSREANRAHRQNQKAKSRTLH